MLEITFFNDILELSSNSLFHDLLFTKTPNLKSYQFVNCFIAIWIYFKYTQISIISNGNNFNKQFEQIHFERSFDDKYFAQSSFFVIIEIDSHFFDLKLLS